MKQPLWKNIEWKNYEEKRSFFNKYFNSTKREFVLEEINKSKSLLKKTIIRFINTEIINKDKTKRFPTIKEITTFIDNM